MAKMLALFSGQGSQYPGMGKDLYDNFAKAREVYAEASEQFGFDVAKASFSGTEEELGRVSVCQPAVFTLSAAAYAAAREEMPVFSAAAGHSLGEYAALWCAGAMGLGDTARVLAVRAGAMERAARERPGAMYAVIGGGREDVEDACREAGGFVRPVNFNLPNQTVLSGEEEAAARAAALLEAQGSRVTRLSVGGAFHTDRMEPAAAELRVAAAALSYHPLMLDFYSNLTGGRLEVEDYPAYFAAQMTSPVRFVEEVAAMAADGVELCVEFGPKRTASTLVKKNCKAIAACNVEDVDTLKKAIQAAGR